MASRYSPVRVSIRNGQEKRIQNAIQSRKRITIHFSKLPENSKQENTGILCLTHQQIKKVHHAPVGTAFAFAFSPAQIKHNIHYKGFFYRSSLRYWLR